MAGREKNKPAVASRQRAHPGPAGRSAARPLGLPRELRLRAQHDFSRVYAEGTRVRGPTILAVVAPPLYPGSSRLGLSVGRKFSRSAVLRNREKRVLRAAFRLLRAQLPAVDVILIPWGRPHRRAPAALRDELMTLILRAQRKWSP